MPSVGMRRSTRVFGTRVLRSGRRLWTGPHEGGKNVRSAHGENKFQELLDNSADGGVGIDDLHKDLWQEDEISTPLDMSTEPKMEERESDGVEEQNVDRKFGIVYTRKRKRAELRTSDLAEDRRYAKKYVRREWRTRNRAIESYAGICNSVGTRELAIIVNESSDDCYYRITSFLTSLLSYMARVRIGMRQLSAFMLSKPILDAYSSCGVLFLQDPITALKPCVCIVYGFGSVMPLFSVNLFAIPPFFVHIQTSMFLRSAHLDCLLVRHCENNEEVIYVVDDAEEPSFQIDQQECTNEASEMSIGSDMACNNVAASDNDTLGERLLGQSAGGIPKSALRSLQLRNSRNIKKRRSSLRRKRGRLPSSFRTQKSKGVLASELFRIRQDGAKFHAVSPSRLRSPDTRRLSTNIKEVKNAMGATARDVCATSCSANLLVTESDRCFRVEGATIALESSASKQWLLSVTKGGTKQCSVIAKKVMRPSCSNRYTHAVIWAGDGSLKLEFPDKQDWYVFKELYKECSDRNMISAAASEIDVPRVKEVPSPVDQYIPWFRPELYIAFKNDELTRALMKKTANYEMDSEDDEWLAKLNDELYVGQELQELITSENFELVIDGLEKYVHYNPDEHIDEQAAYEFCMHLERKEVIQAIYKYWIRKRKQKRAALVRVFQLYQPRRSQVIPKSILRKKRSFKRQASHGGRGKNQPILKGEANFYDGFLRTAIAAERDALEKKNSVHKMQQAKAAANKYEGLATQKRERAQLLMENADLATYKAMMALRIAEAAAAYQVDEAPKIVASPFLGGPIL